MKYGLLPALLLLLLASPPVHGEDASETIDTTTEKLETIQKRMDAAGDKVRRGQRLEQSILGSLESLDRETGRIRQKSKDLAREERELVQKIADAQKNLRGIQRQRERSAGWLARRAAALYKAGNVSYLKVLLHSAGIEDLERRSYYLRILTENDSELFSLTTDLYNREQQQVEALESARIQLASTRKNLEENLSALDGKKREKGLILAMVRDEKEKNATLLRELETSASHLMDLLDALKLQEATGQSAFPTLRGSLRKPVSGKMVRSFGKSRNERFNTYTLSNGVTIQSAEGTPVRSVYRGKVIFADWFSGYGRIIILDHGAGYYTLYGHLAELKASVGQEVDADSIIGLVGDSGSLEGPALYFEIRHHGKPIDPSPWFKG